MSTRPIESNGRKNKLVISGLVTLLLAVASSWIYMNTDRIAKVEAQLKSVEQSRDERTGELRDIRERVTRIENKIDRLLERSLFP